MREYFDQIPIPISEFSPKAQSIITEAVKMANRDRVSLTSGHVLLAMVEKDWDWFSFLMVQFGFDPEHIRGGVREFVSKNKKDISSDMTGKRNLIPKETETMFRMSQNYAHRIFGSTSIESPDIFIAISDEINGVVVFFLRQQGEDVDLFRSKLRRFFSENNGQLDRNVEKRFELPPNLKVYGTNLNLLAIQDKIPPLYGRDEEIRQMIEVLCHKERPNSVLLIGEPGVGKTAIVEGLAVKMVFEPSTLPERLRNCQIVSVQMGTLVAGTSLRGEFEDKVKKVIDEVRSNPDLILFIDEAHTIVGAGKTIGDPSDAAQMFKPMMARGGLRIIGATTLGEYKEYIKEDEALDRRFRTVDVREPSIEETRALLYKLKPRLEDNYSVRIEDEAIETALQMSPRYMRSFRLPDKAIGWLDTASVKTEIAGRDRVGAGDVVEVISRVAKLPVKMVTRDTCEVLSGTETILSKRVVGQGEAIRAVSRRLVLNKGPLKENFHRPDGVFMFLGPTGVGKTELAKALAQFLFGDENRMITVDMSEYQGPGMVGKLIGSGRGMVDSRKGGVLTNQLRENPYAIVLLDEIEKANPDILNLFLQAFGEGWITDGRGKKVYFSDAVVIMTSNVGSEYFKRLTNPLGFRGEDFDPERIKSEVVKELKIRFSPEFLNRVDEVVVFNPLNKTEIGQITDKILEEIRKSMEEERKTLKIDDSIRAVLVKMGYSLEYGARFLKRRIEDLIKIPISAKWKEGKSFRVFLREDEVVVETEDTDKVVV